MLGILLLADPAALSWMLGPYRGGRA